MARAQRRRTRQGGAGQGLPGWAMLTIGLIIGLFVAFLVYLDDLDAPPSSAVERGGDGDGRGVAGAADDDVEAEVEGPRFEFYSILPELEVVVPDMPLAPEEEEPPPGEAAPPAPDAVMPDAPDAPETPRPVREGTYYLQTGSFRKSDQAERLRAEITLLGLEVGVQTVRIDGERWHRVRVGPFTEADSLRAARQRLRENDIDFLVLRERSSG